MHFGDHDMDHDGSLYKTVGTDDFVPLGRSRVDLQLNCCHGKISPAGCVHLGDKSDSDE